MESKLSMEQAFLTWHDQTYGEEARNSLLLEERKVIFFAGWEASLSHVYQALQEALQMVGRGITAQTGQSAGLWSRLLRLPAPKKRAE